MEKEQKTDDAPGRFSLLGTASTMGLHMVSGPLVGGGLGWLADSWLDSWPWGAGIGLVLGIAAGFRNVWIDARYLIRSDARLDSMEKAQRASAKSKPAIQKTVPFSLPAEAGPELSAQADHAASDAAAIIAGTVSAAETGDEEWEETEDAIRRALAGEKNNG